MKFNTLVFDANLPTVQQVNVPTNTDYKVGMKVKRNGSVQSIKPSEFTITSEDGTTIPVDPEKTNGYVTITKDSGDNASFKQYGVHINHGYDFNDVYRRTGQFPATNPGVEYSQVKVSASELGIVGCLANGEGFAEGYTYRYVNASTPAPADLSAWNKSNWNLNTWAVPYQVGFEGETQVYAFCTSPSFWPVGFTLPDGSTCDSEGYWFVDVRPGDPTYTNIRKYWLLTENSYIYHKGQIWKANQYFGSGVEFKVGTPFSADFKLNINEFKSQSGDIAETLADGSSVKVDGTYADGTTFNFDFCIK